MTYYIDGKEVTEEEYREAAPSKFSELQEEGVQGHFHTPTCWPMVSEALAVLPKQITEATESAKKHGVPTRFDQSGRPIFESRQHRKAYLRAYNFHDNQGGYGD